MKSTSLLHWNKLPVLIRVCLISSLLFFPMSTFSKASEQCDDPLPELNIVHPASDVPREFAMFSGIWKGKWGGKLCSRFVIETVNADGAVSGIYSWGKGENFDAEYMRFDSRIKKGKIKFGRRAKFTFRLSSESGEQVDGKRSFNGRVDRVTMDKVDKP